MDTLIRLYLGGKALFEKWNLTNTGANDYYNAPASVRTKPGKVYFFDTSILTSGFPASTLMISPEVPRSPYLDGIKGLAAGPSPF